MSSAFFEDEHRRAYGGGARLVLSVTILLLGAAGRAPAQNTNWAIPPEAAQLQSPMTATPDVLTRGKALFAARCQKCHGSAGTGGGLESDPHHPAANLTAASNPDGVMFFKIWNGRKPMPAFKTELTKDEVWAVVEYVKTLRKND